MDGQGLSRSVWPALCNRLQLEKGQPSLQPGGDTFPFKSSLSEEGLISQLFSPKRRAKCSRSFCSPVHPLMMCSAGEV